MGGDRPGHFRQDGESLRESRRRRVSPRASQPLLARIARIESRRVESRHNLDDARWTNRPEYSRTLHCEDRRPPRGGGGHRAPQIAWSLMRGRATSLVGKGIRLYSGVSNTLSCLCAAPRRVCRVRCAVACGCAGAGAACGVGLGDWVCRDSDCYLTAVLCPINPYMLQAT